MNKEDLKKMKKLGYSIEPTGFGEISVDYNVWYHGKKYYMSKKQLKRLIETTLNKKDNI